MSLPVVLLVNLLIWNRDFDLPRLAAGAAVILAAMWLNQRGRQPVGTAS